MQLLSFLCFTVLFVSTFSNPEEQSSRTWNLAPEPNYGKPGAPANPVQRPIGWLIPPEYPPQPTTRRTTTTTTAKPSHGGGVAYQIVKAVIHAGVSKALSPTTQRPVRLRTTTVRQSQLKRRIRSTTTTTTTEVPIQSSSVASAFQNPVGDENSVLVPVTTYGQDGKPTVVYMFVPKDRILGYQKEGASKKGAGEEVK